MDARKWRTVPSIAAVRGLLKHSHDDVITVHNGGPTNEYGLRFDETSFAVDDGATIVKPDNLLVTQPGRWLLMPVSGGAGDGKECVTIVVDPNGDGDATTVQGGIDALVALKVPGGTIHVREGVYVENLVLPTTKNINFVAMGRASSSGGSDSYPYDDIWPAVQIVGTPLDGQGDPLVDPVAVDYETDPEEGGSDEPHLITFKGFFFCNTFDVAFTFLRNWSEECPTFCFEDCQIFGYSTFIDEEWTYDTAVYRLLNTQVQMLAAFLSLIPATVLLGSDDSGRGILELRNSIIAKGSGRASTARFENSYNYTLRLIDSYVDMSGAVEFGTLVCHNKTRMYDGFSLFADYGCSLDVSNGVTIDGGAYYGWNDPNTVAVPFDMSTNEEIGLSHAPCRVRDAWFYGFILNGSGNCSMQIEGNVLPSARCSPSTSEGHIFKSNRFYDSLLDRAEYGLVIDGDASDFSVVGDNIFECYPEGAALVLDDVHNCAVTGNAFKGEYGCVPAEEQGDADYNVFSGNSNFSAAEIIGAHSLVDGLPVGGPT